MSFDDGFKSNRKLAEEVLNELNIKALFFIISDFVGVKKQSEKYKKIIHNIYPSGPNKSELSDPMDHDDIKFLISSGHQIGCHTLSHQMLSKISSLNELNKELISSKNMLEKDFDIKSYRLSSDVDLNIFDNNFDYQDIRLMVSDMDSTLITVETIDEVAKEVGLKDEISLITKEAMQGHLDFTESFKKRV